MGAIVGQEGQDAWQGSGPPPLTQGLEVRPLMGASDDQGEGHAPPAKDDARRKEGHDLAKGVPKTGR